MIMTANAKMPTVNQSGKFSQETDHYIKANSICHYMGQMKIGKLYDIASHGNFSDREHCFAGDRISQGQCSQ